MTFVAALVNTSCNYLMTSGDFCKITCNHIWYCVFSIYIRHVCFDSFMICPDIKLSVLD